MDSKRLENEKILVHLRGWRKDFPPYASALLSIWSIFDWLIRSLIYV